MDEVLRSVGLTPNEIKVYKALLELKKGTKTPIVRKARVLPSKVYEVLDRLVRRGLVTYFVENNVTQYVPVHPSCVARVFDEKVRELERQKEEFLSGLAKFPAGDFAVDAQIFRGWRGLRNAFSTVYDDLAPQDTYYLLGSTPGENWGAAMDFFLKIDVLFRKKRIRHKAVQQLSTKKQAKEYLARTDSSLWQVRYYPTAGPFSIGIGNTYVVLELLDSDPLCILIRNKKIRDACLRYFEAIWSISKE